MTLRLSPKFRKQIIWMTAVSVASEPGGWQNMTRAAIARKAQCSEGLVSRYLGSMEALRKAIMKEAIKSENLTLIAQGIAAGDQNALTVNPILKHKAISVLYTSGD